MSSTPTPSSITPASLYSLAIYNPSLGPTDETLPNQIVFWTSRSPASQNDCLRQIGLAQGIVEFSRGFSNSQDLNTVETQKSRVVLHELEPGWWILAYIDLTQIHYATDPPTTDYSPREVAPSSVLISQLKTSHRQFILFNGTLENNLSRHGRDVLMQRLEKFYARWAWQWEVMLSGNPAVDIWNGIRIGRAVGDEEKEVLKGFADRNLSEPDGSERLIDLVVSRFGKSSEEEKDSKVKSGFSSRGTGIIPGPDDGCIYRGVGALDKTSIRDLAEWMSRWYQYGDASFDYLTARPSRKKTKRAKSGKKTQSDSQRKSTSSNSRRPSNTEEQASDEQQIRVPPPLIPTGEPSDTQSTASQTERNEATSNLKSSTPKSNAADTNQGQKSGSSSNKLMLNVLTLGTYSAYSAWNRSRDDTETQPTTPDPSVAATDSTNTNETSGRFIIGFTGDLEEDDAETMEHNSSIQQSQNFISSTIWVKRNTTTIPSDQSEVNDDDINNLDLEECRLVAYAAYPFIFAMLFHPSNDSLNKPIFYRSLHQQLGPLKGPLLSSSEKSPQLSSSKGVYDLIFDPAALTVHTSLPNIPEPGPNPSLDLTGPGGLPRIEALHVHSQIIRIIEDSRWKNIPFGVPSGEKERINRTTRGWWIAWMRLDSVEAESKAVAPTTTQSTDLQDAENSSEDPEQSSSQNEIASFINASIKPRRGRREAFIIRKGSEHQRSRSGVSSKDVKSGFGIPIKITEGLGIDTKRYFDQLLNLTART